MSDSCSVNPMQHLASKKPNPIFNHTSAPFMSTGSAMDTLQQNTAVGSSTKKEHDFIGSNAPLPTTQMGEMIVKPRPLLSHNLTGMQTNSHMGTSNAWIEQFSSMKVNDPLEFSQDYKNSYENYERSLYGQSTQNIRPSMGKHQHSGISSRITKTTLHLNNNATTTTNKIYHHNHGHYNQHYHNQHLQSRNPNHTHQPQLHHRHPTSAPELQIKDNKNIDSYFDLEFESVEKEILEQEEGMAAETDTFVMNHEQMEFKKIASDIVGSCTPSGGSTPGRTTPLQSKLTSSRFMGLMRKVSDGVVTIKTKERELFTPETGEVVGGEYFPIIDEQHGK